MMRVRQYDDDGDELTDTQKNVGGTNGSDKMGLTKTESSVLLHI